jgi:hypothetical protein
MLITFNKSSSRKRKYQLLSVVLMLIVGLTAVKTTFAANISLNNGGSLEYGQGVTQATACSGATSLTLTPAETFTNASNNGAFYLSSITVTNVPSGCYGSDFVINAFDNATNTPEPLFNGTATSATIWDNNGTFQIGAGMSGATVTSLSSSSFMVSFTTPVQTSAGVYKLAIQSGVHTPSTCAQGGTCSIGDVGPGGGVVYYINLSGFSETGAPCGSSCHYLEAAPANWHGGGDPATAWANSSYLTTAVGANAQSMELGAGYGNTLAILGQGNDSTTPAGMARAYTGGGKSDWFLPSYREDNELCKYAGGLPTGVLATNCSGGTVITTGPYAFTNGGWYWSSTEAGGSYVFGWIFSSGGFNHLKSEAWRTRPVRAF